MKEMPTINPEDVQSKAQLSKAMALALDLAISDAHTLAGELSDAIIQIDRVISLARSMRGTI